MKFLIRIALLGSIVAGVGAFSCQAKTLKHVDPDDNSLTTSNVAFSDPAKPGKILVTINTGDIIVRGSESAKDVTIRSSAPREDSQKRTDGLRRLDSDVSLFVQEKENTISIDNRKTGTAGLEQLELILTVPLDTAVSVKTGWGGDISIEKIKGAVEVTNVNGLVVLKDLSGSAVVDTMNGEIDARFSRLNVDKPVSLTSMNGSIQLHIPADSKANARLRTQNGSILTDFDEKVLVTKTEATKTIRAAHPEIPEKPELPEKPERPEKPEKADGPDSDARLAAEIRATVEEAKLVAREAAAQAHNALIDAHNAMVDANSQHPHVSRIPRIPATATGGRVVVGTLNGGGTDLQLTTMNGSITIRKSD